MIMSENEILTSIRTAANPLEERYPEAVYGRKK